MKVLLIIFLIITCVSVVMALSDPNSPGTESYDSCLGCSKKSCKPGYVLTKSGRCVKKAQGL